MKENEQDDNVLEGLNQNVKNMFHDILIESIGLKDIEASLIKPLKQKIEGLDDTISSFLMEILKKILNKSFRKVIKF
ncbi:hypothetical protein EW093_00940 [Thiospirochaeta perfilievii]|uniref:Uncharacterized protein n=1 Tax=Thiospirochaeta perfilievii TaxID=252967 RepID=A0A5C1Q7P5_9SPIO|nr:hypothetical protein [Thiospirochaeta perfilievii]QEN03328.1 hypothetical protein EW093_00940 [Thiospirochaeta perfilievii]